MKYRGAPSPLYYPTVYLFPLFPNILAIEDLERKKINYKALVFNAQIPTPPLDHIDENRWGAIIDRGRKFVG